jgi:hypothetical protein
LGAEDIGSAVPSASPAPRRGRWAWAALVLLVLVFPLVYAPRVLFGARDDDPLPPLPAYAHLLVLAVEELAPWEPGSVAALREFDQRSARLDAAYGASDEPPRARAALLSGRWAPRIALEGLGADDWTVLSAAERAGWSVLEAEGAAGVQRAAEHFAARPDSRSAAWIWLPAMEPQALGQALAEFWERAGGHRRRVDTLTVVVGMARPGVSGARPGDSEALCVPLYAELPAALNAGRGSAALVSVVDLAGFLAEILRLPRPDRLHGEIPWDSRPLQLWAALRGAPGGEGALMEIAGSVVWRAPNGRAVLEGGAPRAEAPGPAGWRPLGGAEGQALERKLAALLAGR